MDLCRRPMYADPGWLLVSCRKLEPEARAGTSTSSPNSGPRAISVAAAAVAVVVVASCPQRDPGLAAPHFVPDSVVVAVSVVGFDFLSFVPADFPEFL